MDLWHATLPALRADPARGSGPAAHGPSAARSRGCCAWADEDEEIADLLGLSSRIVELEVKVLLEELHVRNRTEAVRTMRGRGINGGWRNAWP